MILLPNFLANEFRYSVYATNEYFILVFILQRYEKLYFAFPCEKITAKETLFHLGYISNVSRFHRLIYFGDCDVCYLFHRENLESSYKCSNVELICSACVEKTLRLSKRVPHGWYRVI